MRSRALGMLILLAACAPPVQTLRSTRPFPPTDVFSCYMRALAQMEYRVEDSDRDAGFIRAVLEDKGFPLGGQYANEATVTIFPAAPGSEVSVTMRRVRVGAEGGRSSAGMVMGAEAESHLRYLGETCSD